VLPVSGSVSVPLSSPVLVDISVIVDASPESELLLASPVVVVSSDVVLELVSAVVELIDPDAVADADPLDDSVSPPEVDSVFELDAVSPVPSSPHAARLRPSSAIASKGRGATDRWMVA
jgi:hypothetical protein